jgi:hypothetical protein
MVTCRCSLAALTNQNGVRGWRSRLVRPMAGCRAHRVAAYPRCWADLRGEAVRTLMTVGVLVALLGGSAWLPAEPPELKPFAFLVGEWVSSGSGQPGAASGTAVFTRGLQDQVILRNSYAEYRATDAKPASRHDDLMVIYGIPGGGARADYYDNEGHIIRYILSSPGPGRAVFRSEAGAGKPTFRLIYTLEADGLLKGEFAIAPAGAQEAFTTYLTWESRKAAASLTR